MGSPSSSEALGIPTKSVLILTAGPAATTDLLKTWTTLLVVTTTWFGPTAAVTEGGANRPPPNRGAIVSISGPSKFWMGFVTALSSKPICLKLLIAGSVNGPVIVGSKGGLILPVAFFSLSMLAMPNFCIVSSESGAGGISLRFGVSTKATASLTTGFSDEVSRFCGLPFGWRSVRPIDPPAAERSLFKGWLLFSDSRASEPGKNINTERTKPIPIINDPLRYFILKPP